jgi:hypothetical protein
VCCVLFVRSPFELPVPFPGVEFPLVLESWQRFTHPFDELFGFVARGPNLVPDVQWVEPVFAEQVEEEFGPIVLVSGLDFESGSAPLTDIEVAVRCIPELSELWSEREVVRKALLTGLVLLS